MILTCTGHRAPLGSYDLEPLIPIARDALIHLKPDVVVCGLALGWDTAVAIAAIELGIPLHGYIPFVGQADTWPKRSVERYWWLLERCAKKVVVSPGGYAPEKMQIRNEAMVDACDRVLALWDGEEKGGTWNCVKYAMKRKKPIENVWESLVIEDPFVV
jgi:uncharacterized phage-like protein YoqJ